MSTMNFESAAQTLISTKLHRPMVNGSLVHRPRLIDLLDKECSLPLTVVSAPAASGKAVSDLISIERYMLDYLWDEVVSGQPQEIQEYLIKTSVLERLCCDLCAAVTNSSDSVSEGQNILERLSQANLFIVTLHEQPQWYRYHHLFRQFLRNQLVRQFSTTKIADLHRRASAWYAGNGYIEDAIVHALAAGDEATAVQVIEANRHESMNQERWRQLERWLDLISRQVIEESPQLLLLETWILQKQWRVTDMPAHLDRVEALMASTPLPELDAARLRSEIDTLRGMVSYNMLDGERAFVLAKRALKTLPMSYSSVRSLAWMYHGGGLQAMGDIKGGIDVLHEALKEDRIHQRFYEICADRALFHSLDGRRYFKYEAGSGAFS